MCDEQHQFLRLVGQWPARLTVEQAAWVLGCQPYEIAPSGGGQTVEAAGQPRRQRT